MELRFDAWNYFQENCPDVRNTKIVDVICLEWLRYHRNIYDQPVPSGQEEEYKLVTTNTVPNQNLMQ
jgi:hypothetical protein